MSKAGQVPRHNPGHKVDLLLKKADIAARFGVHPNTVQMWWTNGFLASHRVTPGTNTRCYSTEADVVEWGKIFYNVGNEANTGPHKGAPHEDDPEIRRCSACGRAWPVGTVGDGT